MRGDEQIDSLSIEQSADGVAESKTATGDSCHRGGAKHLWGGGALPMVIS